MATEKELKSEFSKEVNDTVKKLINMAEQNPSNRALFMFSIDTTDPEMVELVGTVGGKRKIIINALSKLISQDEKIKDIIESAVAKSIADSAFEELIKDLQKDN